MRQVANLRADFAPRLRCFSVTHGHAPKRLPSVPAASTRRSFNVTLQDGRSIWSRRLASVVTAVATPTLTDRDPPTQQVAVDTLPPTSSNCQALADLAEDSCKKFLSVDGIPAEQLTTAALQSCLRAASALQPQLKKAEALSKASTSRLVALGAEKKGMKIPIDANLQGAANKIAAAAFTIITDKNVEMLPEFLELYVYVQAQLGRPESLPSVLRLFATKKKPVMKNGEIQYVTQNFNAASRAVEASVAELALATAIEVKNLDAALGIVEVSFATPAFRRQKLLRRASGPAVCLAALPIGIFGLSEAYAAYWQNTMDIVTATAIGFTGISGYFLTVGSLGLIAKFSNKDQMKRVTWSPGTPLRHRWLREEERAAFDEIACAWGFKERWRHGEETGLEWEGLKEYLGYRQMLLDRVEFMDGLS